MKYLLTIISAVLFCIVSINAADNKNLMENPGAETWVSPKKYPVKRFHLKNNGKLPIGWGAYGGGGKAVWGISTTEAHSGKSCVYLKFLDWLNRKGKKSILAALLLGTGNGYTPGLGIPANPNTHYRFSFWMKGQFPMLSVRVMYWDNKGKRRFIGVTGLRKNGQGVRRFGKSVMLTPNPNVWEQYGGCFTTPENIKSMVIMITLSWGKPALLETGQAIYIDDAKVEEIKNGGM